MEQKKLKYKKNTYFLENLFTYIVAETSKVGA